MKRLCVTVAVLAGLVLPSVASAHPLGNFTVNHYTRIEPAADRVRIAYVLDMAEIPTFQEQPRLQPDAEAYATERVAEIGRNLHLAINGQSLALTAEQHALTMPAGTGGLPTLRLDIVYSAPVTVSSTGSPIAVTFRDDNDPARIGWREIVARPSDAGIELGASSVPSQDSSDELRHYPEDLLQTPPSVREAHLTFSTLAGGPSSDAVRQPGALLAGGLMPGGAALLDRTRGGLLEVAGGTDLTPTFVLFALGVALVLGMAHALQPGHGKTVVAAYLVGARGTARDALFLGATVTATHTAGVYALGLVTVFLSQYILPERLYPILEIASGLLVVGLGVWLFGVRLLSALGLRRSDSHEHEHDHPHADEGHDHPHAHVHGRPHSHALPERVSGRSLLALGVSGGLLPCPEALMVLLITIAAHRVLFGLLLIVGFSIGLAAVLVGFGLLLVYARGLFSRINLSTGLVPRLLPIASACVIVIAGAVITAQALPRVL